MERYRVLLNIFESFTYEDPKCPFEWKGSGCYDKTEKRLHAREAEVWCNNIDDVTKVVREYAQTQFEKIEKIYFLKIELLCVIEEDGPEEVLDWKPIKHDISRTR